MNKKGGYKRLAILFSIISVILAVSLVFAIFVIVKLHRNNLFSKSILIDNNYFLDNNPYDDATNDELTEEERYVDAEEYIQFVVWQNGEAQIVSYRVAGELKAQIDKVLDLVTAKYPHVSEEVWHENFIKSRVYSIYDLYGLTDEAGEQIEDYLIANFDIDIDIPDLNADAICLDVPYVSQEGILPNGCESVSATMLLNYWGIKMDPEDFVDNYLRSEPTFIKWGCRYGPNPKYAYAGDPRSEDSGFGCFAPVIEEALRKCVGEEYAVKNTTGLTLNTLKNEYVARGIPVAVWVTVNMEEVDKVLQWQAEDKSETYLYPSNEHCMVFLGYDSENYIFADPYESKGIVSYPIKDCVLAYNSLGMQSLAIVKSESGR